MPRPAQSSSHALQQSPAEVILVDDPPAAAASAPELPANLPDDELAGEEHEEDAGGLQLSSVLGSTPPWLVSSGVHLLIVLLLAVMTFTRMEDDKELFIAAGQVEDLDELVELTEILTEADMENMEELEVEDMSTSAAEIDPGEMAIGDLSQTAEVSTDSVSEVTLADTTAVEIGDLFGKDGQGMTDVGDGLKAAATFFGQKAQGNRFAGHQAGRSQEEKEAVTGASAFRCNQESIHDARRRTAAMPARIHDTLTPSLYASGRSVIDWRDEAPNKGLSQFTVNFLPSFC